MKTDKDKLEKELLKHLIEDLDTDDFHIKKTKRNKCPLLSGCDLAKPEPKGKEKGKHNDGTEC